jgi:hypothetical protein
MPSFLRQARISRDFLITYLENPIAYSPDEVLGVDLRITF